MLHGRSARSLKSIVSGPILNLQPNHERNIHLKSFLLLTMAGIKPGPPAQQASTSTLSIGPLPLSPKQLLCVNAIFIFESENLQRMTLAGDCLKIWNVLSCLKQNVNLLFSWNWFWFSCFDRSTYYLVYSYSSTLFCWLSRFSQDYMALVYKSTEICRMPLRRSEAVVGSNPGACQYFPIQSLLNYYLKKQMLYLPMW